MRGGLPERPEDKQTAARGFNDKMWVLMMECWAADPTTRPTAAVILSRLQEDRTEVKDDEPDSGDDVSSEGGSSRPTKRIELGVKDDESDGGGSDDASFESERVSSRSTKRIKLETNR